MFIAISFLEYWKSLNKQSLLKEIKSQFISLLSAASMDKNTTEDLATYAKYLKSRKTRKGFFRICGVRKWYIRILFLFIFSWLFRNALLVK